MIHVKLSFCCVFSFKPVKYFTIASEVVTMKYSSNTNALSFENMNKIEYDYGKQVAYSLYIGLFCVLLKVWFI